MVICQKVWTDQFFYCWTKKDSAHFLNQITILKIQVIKKTKFSKIEIILYNMNIIFFYLPNLQ